ncbi:unnamed protein product [Heterobilharzia americana]|nr:unnamed protein product [Heterobilharzia americana]
MFPILIPSSLGTLSVLLPPRIHDEHSGNIAMLRWPVTTVQFWGENAIGTWQIRLDSIVGSEISRVDPDNYKGFWRSVWIVAYGTDEFPIRLKPPSSEHPPPPEWFESFSEYVVDDQHWHKVYTCHSECAPGGCTGPAADQCIYGCKAFATESRQCVSVCPPGTTAFGALRLSTSLNNYANSNNNNNGQKSLGRLKPEIASSSSLARIRSGYQSDMRDDPMHINSVSQNGNSQQGFKNEMVCQPCWSLCSSCIRPHIEYDCTACSNQRFLVPLLTANEDKGSSFSYHHPHHDNSNDHAGSDGNNNNNNNNNNNHENTKLLNFNLPQVIGTCRTECPIGFFGNKSSSVCEVCAENCAQCIGPKSDECRECYHGFRLILGRCVDRMSTDGRCKSGQYLKHSECVNCHPSCDKTGCVTSNQCNWCPSHLSNFFNYTCTKSCPEGWYSGVQIKPPFYSTDVQNQMSTTKQAYPVHMCEPCSPGCQRCTNFSSCEVCLPYLKLYNGTCVLSSDKSATNYSIIDNNINNSQVIDDRSIGLSSNQCGSTLCSTCYDGMRKSCLSCLPDYYLLEITLFNALRNADLLDSLHPKFICVHICPTGYYVKRTSSNGYEIKICSKCAPSCSSCTDISHCNLCQTGFYLDKKTNTCLLRTQCRLSEYFDEDLGTCRPCDPNCRTCSGPHSFQCTSCNRKPPLPRCLLTNQRVSKLHRTSKDLITWSDQSNSELNSGQCLICCPYRLALTSRDPRQCMFCVADKLFCLSGDEIGAGESGYILEEVNSKEKSLWKLFTKEPSRLILLIICIVVIVRRRCCCHHHQGQYCLCCCHSGYNGQHKKRSKQIVTSVTRKRKARQLAHLTNNNNNHYHYYQYDHHHHHHPNQYFYNSHDEEDDVDDAKAEQISLKSKRRKNNDITISFIDNDDCTVATTDHNNNNNNNNNHVNTGHSYIPCYKSSNCSNGKLHSGSVHRLNSEDQMNSHIVQHSIITSTLTPTTPLLTTATMNFTNLHQQQQHELNNTTSDRDVSNISESSMPSDINS